MATLYLIRHGQASFGSDNYDKLSELGCRQAEVLGHYLRDVGIHLDAAYSGDLQRQQKTAALALSSQAQAVDVTVDARFNEVNNEEHLEHLLPLVMEANPAIKAIVDGGLGNSKNYQKIIEAVFQYWTAPGFEHPEIQSWREYSEDAWAAMQAVMDTQGAGKTIGIFTSGGTIATLVSQVLGVAGSPHTYKFYEPVINCSMTQLFYNGSKVSLSYFNEHAFLRVLGQQLGEELISYR